MHASGNSFIFLEILSKVIFNEFGQRHTEHRP